MRGRRTRHPQTSRTLGATGPGGFKARPQKKCAVTGRAAVARPPWQVCAVAFSKKDMGPQRFLGLDKTIYKNATETRAPARGRYPRL